MPPIGRRRSGEAIQIHSSKSLYTNKIRNSTTRHVCFSYDSWNYTSKSNYLSRFVPSTEYYGSSIIEEPFRYRRVFFPFSFCIICLLICTLRHKCLYNVWNAASSYPSLSSTLIYTRIRMSKNGVHSGQ